MNKVGDRIRRRREMMKMPMSELSRKVGITVSALSQIENMKSYPSLMTLIKIAENLFSSVGELIGENETLSRNPLIKSLDIKFVKVNTGGTTLFELSQHENGKHMEPYMLKFVENSDASGIMSTHPGHEFIHILEGKVIMTLDKSQYLLEKGDNFYFNSNVNHMLKNINNTPAKVLWIISPPYSNINSSLILD